MPTLRQKFKSIHFLSLSFAWIKDNYDVSDGGTSAWLIQNGGHLRFVARRQIYCSRVSKMYSAMMCHLTFPKCIVFWQALCVIIVLVAEFEAFLLVTVKNILYQNVTPCSVCRNFQTFQRNLLRSLKYGGSYFGRNIGIFLSA